MERHYLDVYVGRLWVELRLIGGYPLGLLKSLLVVETVVVIIDEL